MKKIAPIMLCVFMMFGGIVLSACSGSNISLSLSTNYVEIYTNDADRENYQSANIEVSLNGSNDGIDVQVESGDDIVTIASHENSSSSTTITLNAIKSGDARVKVYSRENNAVYDYLNIKVYTLPTATNIIDQNDDNNRTSMFVVKDGEGVSLEVDKYISFEPADVNVKDISWSFNSQNEEISTVYEQDMGDGTTETYAEIVNNTLKVYDACNEQTITVYAIVETDRSLSKPLVFQVIESSSIRYYTIGGHEIDDLDGEVEIDLVRNNSNTDASIDVGVSSISGEVCLATFDENMTLTPKAYLKNSGVEVKAREYFKFTYNSVYDDDRGTLTFYFTIDALYDDYTMEKRFGELYFDLVFEYSEYVYSISAREKLAGEPVLNLSFVPESIVLRDQSGNDIGGNPIDLYSQYYGSQGYLVTGYVYPDDVPLSDDTYRIQIDLSEYIGLADSDSEGFVDRFLQVSDRTGRKIELEQVGNSQTYLSTSIANGTSVYLRSGDLGGNPSINGFPISFLASVNSHVATESLTANLYYITTGTTMAVAEVIYDEDGNESFVDDYTAVKYLSSARNAEGVASTKEYFFRISGISSAEGLSLDRAENQNFTITMDEYARSADDEEQFVIVRVTVTPNGTNFRDRTTFRFYHKSGLTSDTVTLETFVPLAIASVQDNNQASNNIFGETTEEQNYLLVDGEIVAEGASSTTLSSILASAGSNVSILLNYQSATLNTVANTAGYQFFFLNYELLDMEEDEFKSLNVADILNHNNAFTSEGITDYFTYNNGVLSLNDSEFVVFVKVEFYGYDSNHNDVTLVRFFKLESFYPVTILRSNVSDVNLLSHQSLAEGDEELSQVDVTLTLRSDSKVTTYASEDEHLSYFKIILGAETSYVVNNDNLANGTLEDENNSFENMLSLYDISYIYNDYLYLTNFRLVGGNTFRFNIRAESTNFQNHVNDVVMIEYSYGGVTYRESINVNITQVNRVEEVSWLNANADSSIYLNLATNDTLEQNFTIITSVGPSDAYNTSLSHVYQPMDNNGDILQITTSEVGQTFTLSINSATRGGWGYLYLLPADMIKAQGGTRRALVYRQDDLGNMVSEFLALDDIHSWYDAVINGEEGYLNYFLNNDDERIYYSDIIVQIRITVADGTSEETAIRIYEEADFVQEIQENPSLFYRIMNDLALEDYQENFNFSGMIFGDNENVSINLDGISLIGELSGVVKNLTIYGSSTNGAFVASKIGESVTNNNVISAGYRLPTVENVIIDVRYDDESNRYEPSALSGSRSESGTTYAGAIASVNGGIILDSYVYGVTLNTTGVDYVGGLAGWSYGEISGSGVEFYQFAGDDNNYTNTFAGGTIGGLVGRLGSQDFTSSVTNSYVYAFNLNAGVGASGISSYTSNILGAQWFGGLAGSSEGTVNIDTSFAFMGEYANLIGNLGTGTNITNAYITYYSISNGLYYPNFTYYNGNGVLNTVSYSQMNTMPWTGLDSAIWEYENISSEYNFGYPYFKGVKQTMSASVEQTVQFVSGKSLPVDGGENGILFNYSVRENVTGDIANGELEDYNTISLKELFGVTEAESRSLLLSVDNPLYAHFSNSSITTLMTTDNYAGRVVGVTLTSRTDFSNSKKFNIMIIDAIPEFVVTANDIALRDEQILSVQTGARNAQSVSVIVDDSIYLNGESYTLILDDYDYFNEFDETNQYEGVENYYFTHETLGNAIEYQANNASESNVNAKIYLGLTSLGANYESYSEAIKINNTRNLLLYAYDGANSLSVSADLLSFKPLGTTSFTATINSDRVDEKLFIEVGYDDGNGEEIYDVIYSDDMNGTVKINDNLEIYFSMTEEKNGNNIFVNTLIGVSQDYRHRVDKDYNLTLYIRPDSKRTSDDLLSTISLTVLKQSIEDFNVTNYSLLSKQLRNSRWYYVRSENITSTIAPGTETILMVDVNPNYAHMSNFTVTYTLSNPSAGTVSLSRLMYNNSYGYYVDSTTTEALNAYNSTLRGLNVTPTDDDLRNGVYYFRLYISSSFTANSLINLTFTFYDGEEVLKSETVPYTIDYIQEAVVLVNGETSIMLARGDSASVSVEVNIDQTLDSIYLSGHGAYITMTNITETIYPTYKLYTASINTSVLSRLASGAETGTFTVEASVVSYINGRPSYKYSYATISLVDFVVNTSETSLSTSGSTSIYGGVEYDTFNSYMNASNELSFNYSVSPSSYTYNTVEEEIAVNELLQKQRSFQSTGYYADAENGYYINYETNPISGAIEKVSLKERLYYANSDGTYTAVYNNQQNRFLENSTFDFVGGDEGNSITIRGKQSGSVLLRLETIIMVGNNIQRFNYDFVVRISIWTDEEAPIPIYTAEEFLRYLNGNPDSEGNTDSGDYILMNDIILDSYVPQSTQYFDSLDGNGYTIYLNSFTFDNASTTLNLALFSEVTSNSTIKNVRVNLYNAGQITVNIQQYDYINIAGFTLLNNGIIYNCDVVSFYDVNNSSYRVGGNNGIVVSFVRGNGGQAVDLTSGDIRPENINIAGFALDNNSIITNSRVGGETYKYIREEFDERYYDEMSLSLFTIQGQGYVSGFVGENSGTISASFASNMAISNSMQTTLSETAGFVLENLGTINTSYVRGQYSTADDDEYYYDGSTISTTGNVGGFSYYNNGTIKNSYVNFAIEIEQSRSYMSAGFVYRNGSEGIVTLCYAQVKMSSSSINDMSFSGVTEGGVSLNENDDGISYCYYFSDERDIDIQGEYEGIGAYAISTVDDESVYYRFSFASEQNAVDGIWTMLGEGRGITLASADHIAFSNRYIVYDEENEEEYALFYSTLRDYTTRLQVDLSYGSLNNPIIIRSAEDFARATGRATSEEISSYQNYYNDYEVFGNYRFVNDIDFSTIDQNLDDNNAVRLTTTTKEFSGIIDGNGFTISNIVLESSGTLENYGLFASINNGTIMNLGLEVASVHNGTASIVGTLAGTAIDSRLIGLSLSLAGSRDDEDALVAISIHGNNIVGGVVGAVFGNSKLSDILIEDIDVAANYYDEFKTVTNNNYNPNSTLVGESLKNIVEAGGSLSSAVSNLSYAGGLAGYVDIYEDIDEENVTFSGSVDYSTYDLLTIRISNSINIYGEVAGGLVGYLSGTTTAYDMGLELNADMALSTPSYITAKNLYAGGIVGESYGGLFACYAEYTRELQDTIEESMYSYYNSSANVERGQMSIFSFTSSETGVGITSRYNDPYFVGGLVGYAGGGFISTSYNRFNVVSNTSHKRDYQAYFGGLVGCVDSDDYFSSQILNTRGQVSYSLNETYFSGVLNSTTAASMGGAVGLITSDSNVEMRRVNSIPYYDSNSDRSKIFGLIGGFETNVNTDGGLSLTRPSHLYLMDNANGYYDIITNTRLSGNTYETTTTSIAVSAEYLAQNDVLENDATRYNYIFSYRDSLIETFNPDISGAATDIDSAQIMQVEWIRNLSTMESAYTRMNQYFLRNDWEPDYWQHEVGTLYPRIVLTPRTNTVYLDAYEESIREVLDIINENSSYTVIVRGLIDPENPSLGYTDVDLRPFLDASTTARNFSGRFVSYEEYMNSNTEGLVTAGKEVFDGPYIIGGTAGENVGIILDQPIFETVDYGFEMSNLNIYYTNSGNVSTTSYTSLLVARTATNGYFHELDIHLNNPLTLQADSYGMAGLLTAESISTDFVDINIIFRRANLNDNSVDLTFIDSDAERLNGGSQYFGILSGRMLQNSVYKAMTISNINFAVEQKRTSSQQSGGGTATQNSNINFNFVKQTDNSYDLYFGLLSGDSSVEAGSNPSRFRMTSLNRYQGNNYNINITFTKNDSLSGDQNINNAYIGSYFGRANFGYIEGVLGDDNYPLNNITITQNLPVTTEYIGLGFGRLVGNGSMNITKDSDAVVNFVAKGSVVQEGTVETAYIGGLIGQAEMNLSIDSNIETGLSLAGAENITSSANIGSIIGVLNGTFSAKSFSTENSLTVNTSGGVDINYGLIGVLSGRASVEMGVDTDAVAMLSRDDITILNTTGNVNIGGVVGKVESTNSENAVTISNYLNLSTYTIENCANATVGGIVGDASTASFTITSSGFGGKVLLSSVNNNQDFAVGGIIGRAQQSTSPSTLSNIYSFGDVFVSYANNDNRLNTYYFGGAVGFYEVQEGSNVNLTIRNSYSLMSSFNDRVTNAIANYAVNAFVGYGADSVTYSGNYYASGVTFAIQTQSGNNDTYFIAHNASAPTYYGYTLSNNEVQASNTNIVANIRNGISNIVGGTNALDDIKKLNPTLLEAGGNGAFTGVFDNSTARDINWFYVGSSLGDSDNYITARIATLNNAVIVGNGQTINFRSSEDATEVGEEATSDYGFIGEMSTLGNSFSAVTNLVVNNTVSVVSNSGIAVGGIVGHMGASNGGASILYAVGVSGEIIVGGTDNIYVGGLVGNMQGEGMINNAYFDGDIYYSAGANGTATGIAYSQSHLEILNTFSAGSIQTLSSLGYVSLFNDSSASTVTRIFDSYTIMQHFGNTDYDAGIYEGNLGTFVGSQSNCLSDSSGVSYATRSVGYGGATYSKNSLVVSEDDAGTANNNNGYVEVENGTRDVWFYSPYKNYGYGTTGFGFLRNVTIATRESVQTGNSETVNYEYTKYAISDIANIETTTTDFFYPILNSAQFNAMITLSGAADVAEKDRQYMLRYDITANLDRGSNFSNPSAPFTLDGRNNTLTLNSSSSNMNVALFNVIYGNLENLNFKDVKVESTDSSLNLENGMSVYGTLANASYNARIVNVAMQGTLAVTDTYKIVGGVIGVAVNSEIRAVESVVDFALNADSSNSIVGGVVGYAIENSDAREDIAVGIFYSSNAGNISIDDPYARNVGENESSTEEGGQDLVFITASLNGDALTLSSNGTISATTSNVGNGGTSDMQLDSNLSSIIGGIAGVSEVDIDHSYNSATLINGYRQFTSEEQHKIGAVSAGGIAGYSTADISNSFNAGYVVAGNMYNYYETVEGANVERKYGYVALAGGIAGYTTGSIGVNGTSYNDGKVQSVSYFDSKVPAGNDGSEYQIELSSVTWEMNNTGWDGTVDGTGKTINETLNDLEDYINNALYPGQGDAYDGSMYNRKDTSIILTFNFKIKMNTINTARLTHAYALGYQGAEGEMNGANGQYAEIVNDGCIGLIEKDVSFNETIQRYGGVTLSYPYIYDWVEFAEVDENFVASYSQEGNGESSSESMNMISAYDSYGFPSRLNVYYKYSFDMNVLSANRSRNYHSLWRLAGSLNAPTNRYKFTVTDKPYDKTHTVSAEGEVISLDLSVQNAQGVLPGGETEHYFSMPFYQGSGATGYDGSSYEEYMYRLNNTLSLYNNYTTASMGTDISQDLERLYGEIKTYVSNNTPEKKFNIRGNTFSMVYSGDQLSAYTKGVSFTGQIEIGNAPTLSRDGEELSSTSAGIRVQNMTFDLYNGGAQVDLSPLSYTAYISENTIYYTVYYDKDALSENFGGEDLDLSGLSIDAGYTLEYTFRDSLTLTKNNVIQDEEIVIFKIMDEDTLTAISFAEYFAELDSIQTSELPVEFEGIDDEVIAPLLGDDGNYRITYGNLPNSTGEKEAYFIFNSVAEAEAFVGALDESGTVNMYFYYQTYGSGEYEDENIVTHVGVLSDISQDYIFGIGEFGDAGTVLTNTAGVSLDETAGSSIMRLMFPNNSDLGAIKVEFENGNIYFYPQTSDEDKFSYYIDTYGTGIEVSAVSNGTNFYIELDFSMETNSELYSTWQSMLSSATVSTAEVVEDNNTVTVPNRISQTLNGVNVTYILDRSNTTDFTYQDVGNSVEVTRTGSQAVFTANYNYAGAFVGGVGNVQFVTISDNLYYVNSDYVLRVGENGQVSGIRDNKGATYEFTSGNTDTVYGLLTAGTSYTLTTIEYSNATLNIYRHAGGEIRVYEFSGSAYIVDGADRYVYVNDTLTSVTAIDEDYFFVANNGALRNFTLTDIVLSDDDYYLVYSGGLFVGNFGAYSYDPNSNTATYGGANVESMIYRLNLSDLTGTFDITTETGNETANYSGGYNGWFESDYEFYFVATSVVDASYDASDLFRTQVITFDESGLQALIDDNAYNALQIKQYNSTLSDPERLQLFFGTTEVDYNPSDDAVWDTSNSSSLFTFDSSFTATLSDELTDGVSSVAFGAHTGEVVFKADVTSETPYTLTLSDEVVAEKEDEILRFTNAHNIILGDNVYYEGNMILNGTQLYGNGHVINVFGNMNAWKNMIEVNATADSQGLITDTSFAFAVDLTSYAYRGEEITEGYDSALIYVGSENIGGSLINIKLFGSLRNVSSDTTDEFGNVDWRTRNADGRAYIDSSYTEAEVLLRKISLLSSNLTEDSSNLQNITSAMTIQGKSAKANDRIVASMTVSSGDDFGYNQYNIKDGANVNVVLSVGEQVSANKTYVVLGDGANGANGAESGLTGANGGNGGKAGIVDSTGKDDKTNEENGATVFYGIDGLGGNGGNGADGKNASYYYVNIIIPRIDASTGGGGGGAYGLDGNVYKLTNADGTYTLTYNGTIETTVLSNRRQARDSKNIDGTQISALAGNGGTGGLGLIYIGGVSDDNVYDAFHRDRGSLGPTYPNEYATSWYITAAGGGAAGRRDNYQDAGGRRHVGETGESGMAGYEIGTKGSSSFERGSFTHGEVNEYSYIYTSQAKSSYYFADHHGDYPNEFLFGNLQYIPAFSHWYITPASYGHDNVNIIVRPPDGYNDDRYGGVLLGRENSTYDDVSTLTGYFNYFLADKTSIWKDIYYGGAGGYFTTSINPNGVYPEMYGGTPYTKEILGYVLFEDEIASYSGYGQYFFTRNDMVTSGGSFGMAQGVYIK